MVYLLAIYRVLTMRRLSPWVLTIVAPALSSCGLYMHSDRLKTQTEALQTSVKGLNAPQYLAAQQTYLENAAGREDLALTRYLVASRDLSLLNVVKPPAASAARRPAEIRLLGGISSELSLSAGKPFLATDESDRLKTAPSHVAVAELAIPVYKDQEKNLAALYVSVGGKGKSDCASVRQTPNVPGDSKGAADTYANLRSLCALWNDMVVALPDCGVGLKAGNLFRVCGEIAKLESETLTKERKKQFNDALKALNDRVAKEPAPATKDLADVLEKVKKAVAEVKAAPTNDDYKKIFEATETLLGVDLTKALDAVVKNGENAKLDKVSAFVEALLPAIDATIDFKRPEVAALDQPSAILIAVAKIRHDLNLVQLEIDERTQKVALLKQQAAALRAQLYSLARAQSALCAGQAPEACQPTANPGGRSEALAYYINSFNQGLIPYEVLRGRELQLRRITLIKKAQVTEADYRALIQPAVDQIAAYGAGGVNPDVLGPFLASLPVTGAIIAK